MLDQEQDLGTQDTSQTTDDLGEKSLDDILEIEAEQAEELDTQSSNTPAKESKASGDGKGDSPKDGDEPAEAEAAPDGDDAEGQVSDYKPNTKYKVQDQEYQFHDSLKELVNEETEPILRELHEKAKGLEIIKPEIRGYPPATLDGNRPAAQHPRRGWPGNGLPPEQRSRFVLRVAEGR
jgi:hypothetical protein